MRHPFVDKHEVINTLKVPNIDICTQAADFWAPKVAPSDPLLAFWSSRTARGANEGPAPGEFLDDPAMSARLPRKRRRETAPSNTEAPIRQRGQRKRKWMVLRNVPETDPILISAGHEFVLLFNTGSNLGYSPTLC